MQTIIMDGKTCRYGEHKRPAYNSDTRLSCRNHSKNHVADFTSAKTYSPRLLKSTKSKILLILVIDCLILKKRNSRERQVPVWCFYAEKCSERSRVRISDGPKNIFSDKIQQRRKINDQSRGIKAKRHTPMEYDDLH
jgi:hypothetical protein